jgi:hypothetical protein
MDKDTTNTVETKTAKETIPKKNDAKFNKEGSKSTPDKTSSDVKDAKTDQSDSSNTNSKTYHRGEGQKPVTKEYRDNWNSIFRKENK